MISTPVTCWTADTSIPTSAKRSGWGQTRRWPTIDGITGTFTFDEHHDPVKETAILTYVDGKPELKEMF